MRRTRRSEQRVRAAVLAERGHGRGDGRGDESRPRASASVARFRVGGTPRRAARCLPVSGEEHGVLPRRIVHRDLLPHHQHDRGDVRASGAERPGAVPLREEGCQKRLLQDDDARVVGAVRAPQRLGHLLPPDAPLRLGVREARGDVQVRVRGAPGARDPPDGVAQAALVHRRDHLLGVSQKKRLRRASFGTRVPGTEGPARNLQRYVQGHGRSAPHRARAAHVAAQRGHDVLGDGQAEARAAVLARGRRRGLAEGLEHDAQLVLGDADASVRNLQADPEPLALACRQSVGRGRSWLVVLVAGRSRGDGASARVPPARRRRRTARRRRRLRRQIRRRQYIIAARSSEREPRAAVLTARVPPASFVASPNKRTVRIGGHRVWSLPVERRHCRPRAEPVDSHAHLAPLARVLHGVVRDVDERLPQTELVPAEYQPA